jgi:DNA-binding transcriptional ArsR family regulator
MISKQAEKFKVLGVESRIRIIELLKEKGALCVNEISDVLGITASAVSQHLKVLKYAGLVRNERRGYWIHYEVDPVALEQCNQMLSEVCMCDCQGMDRMHRMHGPGNRHEPQPEIPSDEPEDNMELLKKYESELETELKEIRARIEETIGK